MVYVAIECKTCGHPRLESPGNFTAYEGKTYWSADGIEVTCHLKRPYTCDRCPEEKT